MQIIMQITLQVNRELLLSNFIAIQLNDNMNSDGKKAKIRGVSKDVVKQAFLSNNVSVKYDKHYLNGTLKYGFKNKIKWCQSTSINIMPSILTRSVL